MGSLKSETSEAYRKLLQAQDLLEDVETHFAEIDICLIHAEDTKRRGILKYLTKKLLKSQDFCQKANEVLLTFTPSITVEDIGTCLPLRQPDILEEMMLKIREKEGV